jgi:hypothetical protein
MTETGNHCGIVFAFHSQWEICLFGQVYFDFRR